MKKKNQLNKETIALFLLSLFICISVYFWARFLVRGINLSIYGEFPNVRWFTNFRLVIIPCIGLIFSFIPPFWLSRKKKYKQAWFLVAVSFLFLPVWLYFLAPDLILRVMSYY